MLGFRSLLLAVGLVATIVVIAAYGFDDIFAALLSVGWGILWIVIIHAVPLFADMMGWAALFNRNERPSLLSLYRARWASESVNNLLPVAQVGGEVVRVRLATQSGCPADRAGATVIIDFTMGLFTLMIFSVMGLVLFFLQNGASGEIAAIATGILIFTALVVGFFLAQRAGLFVRAIDFSAWIARLIKRDHLAGVAGGVRRLDAALHDLYRQHGRLTTCAVLRLTSFVIGSAEVWIGLYFLGQHIGIAEAIIIQSLTMAVRSAAFAIPGGLGAQEGGFLVVGTMLGLSPESALALALLKRVREIVFGVPGLAIWWYAEHRTLARAEAAKE